MALRRSENARSWLTGVVVGLGVLVSLGLIGVSAILNFRMGFHSAEGGVDGYVYGVGAACGDGLKAMAPFMGHWAMTVRDRLAVGVAVVVFVVLTAYSFTAAYGFAVEHRADRTAAADKHIEDHQDAANTLKRVTVRLDAMGATRTPREVQADIDAAYAMPIGRSTLGEASDHCARLRTATRKPCAEIRTLEKELALAEEHAKLTGQADMLRDELKGQGPTRTTDDPQSDGIATLLAVIHVKVDKANVAYALALLLAGLVELGSGFGLYLVTTPLRAPVPRQVETATKQGRVSDSSLLRGEVADYVSANLVLVDGGTAAMDDLFTDYIGWCRRLNRYAVARASFEKAFSRFAQLAGIGADGGGEDVMFSGVAIVGE